MNFEYYFSIYLVNQKLHSLSIELTVHSHETASIIIHLLFINRLSWKNLKMNLSKFAKYFFMFYYMTVAKFNNQK